MSLKERLDADFKLALKNKETAKLSTLRLIKAELTNLEKEKKAVKLNDPQILATIQRAVKKRKEAIVAYKKGGREDLAQKEAQEIDFLQLYLPKQLSEEEITDAVKEIIAKTGASGPQDIGKVMGSIMKKLAGQADGQQVKTIVQKLLSS